MELKAVVEARPTDSYENDKEADIKSNADKSVIDVTFEAGNFKIVKADHSIGRDIDAAWFGLKVTAPQISDLSKATYDNGQGTTLKYFTAHEDSTNKANTENRYIYVYGSITEAKLTEAIKNGNTLTYTWRFDWDGDEKIDQTINVKVVTKGLTLKDEEGETLWNEKIAEMVETQVKNETPVEETTATEESGKDSQPKTGEEIPMALVGMMTLGLAGAYTFKKSNVIRRRQRQCSRS